MCTMFGTQLTRAVLGEETDMPIEPIDIVPGHAFRQLGITWHLATGRLRDRRDVTGPVPSVA